MEDQDPTIDLRHQISERFKHDPEEVAAYEMFLHVQHLKPTKDYELLIEFTNDIVKDVDLRSELYGPIFEPLRDLEVLKQVRVNEDARTSEWPNRTDFVPEFFYEVGRKGAECLKVAPCTPEPLTKQTTSLTCGSDREKALFYGPH